jgi:hypothetical protein
MKNNHMNKVIVAIKKVSYCLMVLVLVILPGISFSQPTPPTGSGGAGGGIPDSPLSVPFDSRLSVLLVAAGVLLAVVVITSMQKKKIIAN